MKNHWLDNKIDKEIDKEIDKAFEEFKDTDFIDLSCVTQHNDRYKEYDRLALQEKFIEENVKALDSFDFGDDEHDRAVVTEILLKYKNKPHWIYGVLVDVGYYGHTTQDTLGNLTIDTTNAIMFDATAFMSEGMSEGKWPDWYTINTPGGDGIILGEVKTSEFGQICSVCNEEMWPMNTATTMGHGDPSCACSNPCGNLDSWYPDQKFIQNETLQVLNDLNTNITQYQTNYVSVIAGTMTGTIYPTPGNTSYGFVFYVSSDGKFTFDQFVQADGKVEYASKQPQISDGEYLEKMANGLFDDRFMGWYDEAYVEGTTLNLQTGVLELHYYMGKRPEIVVSYEWQKVDSL